MTYVESYNPFEGDEKNDIRYKQNISKAEIEETETDRCGYEKDIPVWILEELKLMETVN